MSVKKELGPENAGEPQQEGKSEGGAWWVTPVACLLFGALGFGVLLVMDRRGIEPPWGRPPAIGNVIRAYGTVKRTASYARGGSWLGSRLDDSWSRLEAGRSILETLRSGDQVQTGDDSSAEILLFGGSTLQLESASLVRFAEEDEDVSIRLVLGRGYFEFPPVSRASGASNRFVFRKSDGSLAEVPEGRQLVLSLNAVERLEDAVEVNIVEAEENMSVDNLEMRYLAHGEEVASLYPLLVPPIDFEGEFDPDALKRERFRDLAHLRPKPVFPEPDDDVDVDADTGAKFKWDKVEGDKGDPVIGYEIIVRPAFGYESDDRARKEQVFRQVTNDFPIEKVGGGGVFLWSVRAVTASGLRGPASDTRWLEVKFPKQMLPPQLLKPKVE